MISCSGLSRETRAAYDEPRWVEMERDIRPTHQSSVSETMMTILETLPHEPIHLPPTEPFHQGDPLMLAAITAVHILHNSREQQSYLVRSFSHELLCRHFPDGRNCDDPSHVVVVKLPTCLIAQLLPEGVYSRNASQTM